MVLVQGVAEGGVGGGPVVQVVVAKLCCAVGDLAMAEEDPLDGDRVGVGEAEEHDFVVDDREERDGAEEEGHEDQDNDCACFWIFRLQVIGADVGLGLSSHAIGWCCRVSGYCTGMAWG